MSASKQNNWEDDRGDDYDEYDGDYYYDGDNSLFLFPWEENIGLHNSAGIWMDFQSACVWV